jgi:histidinol-phosphate aminotransferase
MTTYQKPPELHGGLRLHQNENTGGCSPRVLEALRNLGRDQISQYPQSSAATEAVANHFGVPTDSIVLTNGLNEGIMALAVSHLRPTHKLMPEAIVPDPAFEIFRVHTAIAGGKLTQIMPRKDFAFPLNEVLAAIIPATRVVFLSNPNNPTGVSMPLDAIETIAGSVPKEAVVFVDEAYSEFAGVSFISRLSEFPNVVIGRTFSKAFGLASLRVGCLIGEPQTLEPIRAAVPVYSVNLAAITALQAALADRDYLNDYLQQVAESKALFYSACDRLGLEYWKSSANFVLVYAGDRIDLLLNGLAARGIYIRDRSSEPGCAGCIRIVTGIVEHTRQCITAMEEILCAEP